MKVSLKQLTGTAVLLSVSFLLSFLESILPIGAIVPVPGLKIGLANLAVMAALVLLGRGSALAVVLLRPLLSLALFGNAGSFLFSLLGGLCAYAALLGVFPLYRRVFSYGGLSVTSAVFHAVGQIAAASFVMKSTAILWYLPLLAAASAVTGLFNGMIMNVVLPRLADAKRGEART